MINTEISNWGCGSIKTYISYVNNLINDYCAKETANAEKIAKRKAKGNHWVGDVKNITFKNYPIDIAIEKLGYTGPKATPKPWSRSRDIDKLPWDFNAYSKSMYNAIVNGDVDIETLACWWRAYDAEKSKTKWFNMKAIFKDVNYSALFDPHYVDDFSVINNILANPFNMTYYLKDSTNYRRYSLTAAERVEIEKEFKSEENLKLIAKLVKKAMPDIVSCAPTIKSAIDTYIGDIFDDPSRRISFEGFYFHGRSVDSVFAIENRDRDTWYHGEANFISDLGKSLKKIIVDTMRSAYKTDNELLDALQSGEHITIVDEGNSKTEHGSVVSSSFWTYYKHDFSVKLWVWPNSNIETDEPVIVKKFENVVTGSSYFSGGWN